MSFILNENVCCVEGVEAAADQSLCKAVQNSVSNCASMYKILARLYSLVQVSV